MPLAAAQPLTNPLSITAGSALTGLRRFHYVALDTGTPRLAVSGVGARVDGVLRYPALDETATTLDCYGILVVEAGAAVAVDDEVVPDSVGRAVTGYGYVTMERGVGRALQAATAAGQFIEVLFYGPGQVAGLADGVEEIATDAQTYSVLLKNTLVTSNGTWTATLPNGTIPGQKKFIRLHIDTSGQVTITYTGRNNGAATTSIVLDTVEDQVELEWSGAAWITIRHLGAAFA